MRLLKYIIILCLFYIGILANELEKVSLQLLWKHQFEFAGFYMAKEKGFYKDVNLDVDIKEFEFGLNVTQEIENGKSTFGIGYPNIILDKANGANIVLLNALYQSSPHVLVSLKSSGINEIKEFKNKRLMIEGDAIKTAPLLSMLYSQNIKIENLNRQNPSFNIDDLIDGKTDIFSSYLSNEVYKLDKNNIKYNIFDPKDYGFDFYNDLLFTSQNEIKNNPQMVKKFQEASIKGWEYAFSNIDETINIILKKYNSLNKTKEALQYEANILKSLAFIDNIKFGDIDKNKLQRIYDIYNLMGLTKTTINFDQLVFNSKAIYFTQDEKKFIKNNNIVASVSKDWRPFSFQGDDGTAQGISSDYWNLIVEKINLNSEYKFFDTFTEQLNSIENKTTDVIYSTGKTKERENYSIFTKEYIKFPISIVTLKDENYIESASFLHNKKVAVGRNFTAHKLFKKAYPNIKLILVDSIKDGLKLVDRKEVYAFIDIKPSLIYNINKLGFNNLKVTGNTGLEFSLRIMIRDDYQLLQSILNKTINSISEDELNSIIKRWENIHFEKEFDYKIFQKIMILLAIVLFFFIYRQYILNRANIKLQETVDEKTKELQDLNKNLEKRVEEAIKENSQKDTMLFSQSKMAAMGEMIGNIAHQWRQPLSVISTTASGIQLQIEYDVFNKDEAIQNLESLISATKYLSQTIDDFQEFLKPAKKSKSFNIKDIINKHIDMFGKSFTNNNIEFIIDIDNLLVNGNENELLQVIINILNNAKDALKEQQTEYKYIFIELRKDEKNVTLIIKDNAGGIPEDILPKIFEPYFTTKHKSQGTGIGLYMSYQIIANTFNGILKASNIEYKHNAINCKGAMFEIIIPLEH